MTSPGAPDDLDPRANLDGAGRAEATRRGLACLVRMHPRARVLPFLIGAAVMAAAQPVDAMCAEPSAALFPVAGTPLPADPTLYLFVPSRHEEAAQEVVVIAKDANTGEPLAVSSSLVNR